MHGLWLRLGASRHRSRPHCVPQMITFVDLPALPAAYERLVASDWRAVQRNAHRRFARRFAPAAIFRRAGVYRDWGISRASTSRSSKDEGSAALYVHYASDGTRTYTPASGLPTAMLNSSACTPGDVDG